MATINFTRDFQHEDWVDNVDRVQAAGDNGINARFHGIEADLDKVGTVIEQVSRSLDKLAATPPAQIVAVAVTPAFVTTAGNGWGHGNGFAKKQTGNFTDAHGMVGVAFPEGARVQKLRVVGRGPATGTLFIRLCRQSFADIGRTEVLAEVQGRTVPFDRSERVEPMLEDVDDDTFKYFVTADLDNTQAGDLAVMISGIQIVYATS